MLQNKNTKIAFASASFIILVIFFYILLRSGHAYTDNAYLKSDITIVKSKITGYITEILIEDNQVVKKDQIIAKIDDQDYKLKLEQAESDANAAKAKLEILKQRIIIQDHEIEKALLEQDSAKATLDKANKDLKRANSLVKDRAIAQQEFDRNYELQNVAENKYSAAKLILAAAKLRKIVLESEIDEAKAKLNSLEAGLELAKIDLDNTNVKAPTDGVISRRSLQVGQLASSTSALAYIVQNNIWILANFKEVQIAEIHEAQAAIVTIDAFPGKEFIAQVASLSPATGAEFSMLPPENATGNFTKIVQRVPIKLVFDANQNLSKLRTGLSCEVRLQ